MKQLLSITINQLHLLLIGLLIFPAMDVRRIEHVPADKRRSRNVGKEMLWKKQLPIERRGRHYGGKESDVKHVLPKICKTSVRPKDKWHRGAAVRKNTTQHVTILSPMMTYHGLHFPWGVVLIQSRSLLFLLEE